MQVAYVAPAPNIEREQRTRDLLRSLDPQLDILWRPYVVKEWDTAEAMLRYEGRYALIYRLRPNDPGRWLSQQTGAEEAYDTLGWFCADMSVPQTSPLPCDEVEPKLRTFLGEIDAERQSHDDRFRNIIGDNEAMQHARERDYVDEAVQRALDRRRTAFGVPFVSQYSRRS